MIISVSESDNYEKVILQDCSESKVLVLRAKYHGDVNKVTISPYNASAIAFTKTEAAELVDILQRFISSDSILDKPSTEG
jgi:hypothetical protein